METMRQNRVMGRRLVLLALVLFGAWLCAGWLHEHPDASSCQVCKELAASAADVVRYQAAPEPPQTPERIRTATWDVSLEFFVALPHGRAPPTA